MPCSETIFCTARPIAQIWLRPTQTPACSLQRSAAMPKRAHASITALFERAHQRHDLAKALELADRIDDELARAVVGNVAAALDLDDVDALRGE